MQELLIRLWFRDPLICIIGLLLSLKVVHDILFVLLVYTKTRGSGVIGLVILNRKEELRKLNVTWIYNGYLVYRYSWHVLFILVMMNIVLFPH